MGNAVEILLVEDNPDDLELALHALRRNHLADSIQVTRDGEETLDFLFCRNAYRDRAFDMPPKVVILDLKLPKLSGLEVLRELKTDPRTRPIPVVILTSSNLTKDLAEAYQLGVNSYIQKPVDFSEFDRIIKDLGLYWLRVNQCPPTITYRLTASP